jgi:hypothetical protein
MKAEKSMTVTLESLDCAGLAQNGRLGWWSGFDVRYSTSRALASERQIQSSTRANTLLVVLCFQHSQMNPPRTGCECWKRTTSSIGEAAHDDPAFSVGILDTESPLGVADFPLTRQITKSGFHNFRLAFVLRLTPPIAIDIRKYLILN